MDKRSRVFAERWGRAAETLAALALRAKGYRVLARRVRSVHGEIDLIARTGGTYVFIEVKARTTQLAALDAVSDAAWQRISACAESWAARHMPAGGDFGWRYDVVAVCPWRWPKHFRDVWRPDFALTAG